MSHDHKLLPRDAIAKAMNAAIDLLAEARFGPDSKGCLPYDIIVVAANLLAHVVFFTPDHPDGPASHEARTADVISEVQRLLADLPRLVVLPGGQP